MISFSGLSILFITNTVGFPLTWTIWANDLSLAVILDLPSTINNSYQGVSKKDITSEFNKNSEFFNNKINDLLTKYGDEPVYPNPRCDEIFDYLGKNKFYSLIID